MARNIQIAMQDKLNEIIDGGRDYGMQLAVYYKGELVVNAWAGVADTETRKPVTENTLFPVFSVTKGITATMIHILADRGALRYDQKVCEFWPEFARNGKKDITIRHTLSHTAGIPQMPYNLGRSDLNDWSRMCDIIAESEPLWAPGGPAVYHALTYGWILGRVIELAGAKPFAKFLKDEICDPPGIRNLYIGIPEDAAPSLSIATLYEPGFNADALNTGVKTVPKCCNPMCDWINERDTLKACIPAGNGTMNAMSLARHYASLLPGGVDGVRLLSDDTINAAVQATSIEGSPEPTNVFGLGYSLGFKGSMYGSRPTLFGHGGYGGSVGFADLEHDFALGLTKNYFHANSAELEIVRAVQNYLNIPPD